MKQTESQCKHCVYNLKIVCGVTFCPFARCIKNPMPKDNEKKN
ncbi:MAG: hypothetical protein RSD54_09565 [Ruthenibacterium sp.]